MHQSFENLLTENAGILYKVAKSYCWHPDDRKDLLQEMATQLWRAYPKYDAQRPLATWMYRIALNVAISYVRNVSLHRQHLTALDDAPEVMTITDQSTGSEADNVQALQAFIEQLEPLNRALMLLYLDEFSHNEIAEILGLSSSNVSTKINRLKQRIRLAFNATDKE